MTLYTPGICFAAPSSTCATLPPNTGDAAIVANFMPGNIASMPYTAEPSTLPGVSKRFSGLPIKVKFFGSFSCGFFGGVSFVAVSASAP